ncbi:hypothetical protein HF325_002985 [Metschnikowia pulcherrima]|uniref:Protein IFH1 n=1 Tax=Metschnikowia pulcherrima TaxID=27326 RepID=A0A8H7GRZ0_9ASCO|nr:hypothetical protein HF325_002985 [Metschnikowia pulcherrima]
MARTARKGGPLGPKSSISQKLNPRFYLASKSGGKHINAYQFNQNHSRRLSLAESTSSESSDGLAGKGHYKHKRSNSGSDSDSSLTAMFEEHENAASRKGSVLFESTDVPSAIRNISRSQKSGKAACSARPSKALKTARKAVSGKSLYYPAASSSEGELADEDDGAEIGADLQSIVGEEDEDDDNKVGLEAIYSMVGGNNSYMSSNSEDSNDDDSPDDEGDSSSSDDSEVDFVRLQVERRKNINKSGQKVEKERKPKDTLSLEKTKKRRKSSIYRRRSEVPFPEDLNFKFEFDDPASEVAVGEESSDDRPLAKMAKEEEEEDLGEEVMNDNNNQTFDFHFDQPLIDVPKINEEELNSDDEYDFDDNDLLATLQADNDLEEFITDSKSDFPKVRQGSLSSMNDEENEESFLKEEEKYLVNEFEMNGFDDDDMDAERMETTRAVNSFNEMDNSSAKNSQALQYASSSDERSHDSFDEEEDEAGEYDYDEEDGDDYVDFIDFDLPFFDEANAEADGVKEITSLSSKSGQVKQKKAHFPKRKKGPLESEGEDEDDSYLWNYFFSSDAETYSGSEIDQYDADEQLVLEEVFRQNLEDRKKQLEHESSMEPVDSEQDQAYDSGESTDVDLSLPAPAADNGVGAKLAKEVLSSKTADYRPPVLGTWAAIDSKPLGSSMGFQHDLAIELEELLNVSELDNDDENDVRIWRDFNNNKKHVPLGAFRNKAHITHPIVVAEPMTNYNVTKNTNFNRKRRYSNSQVKAKLALRHLQNPPAPAVSTSLSKDLNLPSKLKLRRASIADAVSEGYRPTKSGLFSENVLADVEEVLGEDRDFMALVTGL